MVANLRYFNSLKHEVDSLKSQLETQKTQFLNEIDQLLREYYYADHMNPILGVYTKIDEVSNLQCDYLETLEKYEHLEKELSKEKIKNDKSLKENLSKVFLKECEQYFEIQDLKAQLQDKGIAISELKKLIEKMKRKSVETKKCVLNVNHDLYVLHYINGVNSSTRQPIAMPISTREPKQNVNQSAATSYKKTVTTDSTVKKPRNIIRKIYEQLVEIILFIVDFGCSKHMPGNLKLLINFVEKFLGTVKFRNDQIAPILDYGDLVQGTITIKRVYYVKGLNHNLFSVGQFCDADLEVAFRKSTCYILDLKGNDFLTGKAKRKSFLTKTTLSSKRRLQLLHMDLCGLMHVESINGKKYVLVIVDDLSRYTWTHFMRSKDETPEVLIDFLTLVQRGLHAQMASDHVSSDPVLQSKTVTTSNEMDLLFSLMFDELLNGTTPVVLESSAVNATDAPHKRQQNNTTQSSTTTVVADAPPLNIQTTPQPTNQAPTHVPTVNATENIYSSRNQ
ncbi:retrovirus-related pol polyprotein from transposon TNT 1-94 [Tanacetum coccineum]